MDRIRLLNAFDTALLDYQLLHADVPINVNCLLLGKGPAPDIGVLRNWVSDRLRRFPLLTERLVCVPGRRVRYGWWADPDVDLDHLVREHRMPPDGFAAGTALRDFVERRGGAVVSVAGPPWELWLLRSADDTEFALLYRASHIQQDGTAKNLVLSALFGVGSDPTAFVPPQRREPGRNRSREVGAAVARSLHWFAPTTDPAPFAASRLGRTTHSWATTSLARLRSIGAPVDGTVNDVFLAGLAGALRHWVGIAQATAGMPVAMAVSTRQPGERAMLANFVAGARVVLPCAEPLPLDRLLAVRNSMDRLKQGGTLGVGERLLFELLPARVRPRLFGAGLSGRSSVLSVSNQAGAPGPLAVAGQPITTAVPLPTLFPGQRLACHLSGLGDAVSIGTAADAGLPGSRDLAALWMAEIDELEAAVRELTAGRGQWTDARRDGHRGGRWGGGWGLGGRGLGGRGLGGRGDGGRGDGGRAAAGA
ncbi:Wax ester synthase-like Acyl-CoA acyltransferase domain-containing protein [Frankia sp. EI5c]|uniref:wax ester/triacylglycerol synthase domain-containing protein n=1 Tax=Frankia sp. EI5c TaxID=683316 RepID=UPI0007C345D8|nr:wax ester/triacylglycerol synthase domain-containing protein [Frankia sp. EI5c]OAA25231.1 Wax ester synthase-like Acyl-CoA acyltransferase domain-containing protein [Frankia sp. EI5c]